MTTEAVPTRQRSTPLRGTQSFVHTLSNVWRRPSLIALEVAWRWAFGIPALLLLCWRARSVLSRLTQGTFEPARLGLDRVFLHDPVGALSADPMGSVAKVMDALTQVRGGLTPVDLALLPALALMWIALSAVGRTVLLRRVDAALKPGPWTLMALHAIRVAVLALVFRLWFGLVAWAGAFAVTSQTAAGAEPNLVLYCALVIVGSLAMFTGWAFLNWAFTLAPLLAMARGLGAPAALRAAIFSGPVRGKLIEVNLVLGIVKIALIVLAMVFSATPLPFESVTTAGFLAWWWAGVAVLWILWSDFFHVARLVGYLRLWRAYDSGSAQ